jgi:hypothetical protein
MFLYRRNLQYAMHQPEYPVPKLHRNINNFEDFRLLAQDQPIEAPILVTDWLE